MTAYEVIVKPVDGNQTAIVSMALSPFAQILERFRSLGASVEVYETSILRGAVIEESLRPTIGAASLELVGPSRASSLAAWLARLDPDAMYEMYFSEV